MIGKSTANMSLEELQKAVMGGNPNVQPFQALAAIQKMVKSEKMKQAQAAKQAAPQGMVAERMLAEAAALRNPYMAAGLGAAPVAPPVTTPMGEEAPVGMAGGGMVAFAKGGDTSGYTVDYSPQSLEDQLAAIQKYKEALGAKNAEYMAPLEAQAAKYGENANKAEKGALNDALIAAGLGMMAGRSQYAMQNIGEGGLKGLATYQDAQKLAQASRDKGLQAQAEMAKSRIALEKGDETAAVQMANQARQDKQTQATLGLQAQHFYNADKAAMAAASARAGLGGMLTPYQFGQLRDKASDNVDKRLKDNPMELINARSAAKKAGEKFDESTFRARLVDEQFKKMVRDYGGGATIPQNTPSNPGAGGKDKVIDFSSI